MTRTEALEKLKMPTYNSKTLDNDIEYVCQKFEISLEEFNKIIFNQISAIIKIILITNYLSHL